MALGRTTLLAIVVALSSFDPSLVNRIGPILAVVVLFTGNPAKIKITPTVASALLLLLWVTLSVGWSSAYDIFPSLATWLGQIILFICIVDFVQTRTHLRVLGVAYLVGALFAVALSVMTASATSENQRLSVIADVNVNYLGYSFAAGFSIIALLWVIGNRTRVENIALLTSGVALIIGIEITETRGAYLGLILTVMWLCAWAIFRLRSPRIVVLGVLAAAFVTATGVMDQASLQFETGQRATGDWSGRLNIWPIARQVWSENPIAGVGVGALRENMGINVAAHNAILEVGATFGLIGLVLYCTVFWTALGRGSRGAPVRRRALLIGSYLTASAPAFLTGAWITAPAAWVVLAIFARIGALAPTDSYDSKKQRSPSP